MVLPLGQRSSDAYERLLLDCMMGDQTLFTRADEVEAAWQVVTPALSAFGILRLIQRRFPSMKLARGNLQKQNS